MVVCGGDLRQIPPVVQGAGEDQVCDATVCLSTALWPKFEKVELQHPVRDASDPEYSAFVDGLGDGTHVVPQLEPVRHGDAIGRNTKGRRKQLTRRKGKRK